MYRSLLTHDITSLLLMPFPGQRSKRRRAYDIGYIFILTFLPDIQDILHLI